MMLQIVCEHCDMPVYCYENQHRRVSVGREEQQGCKWLLQATTEVRCISCVAGMCGEPHVAARGEMGHHMLT